MLVLPYFVLKTQISMIPFLIQIVPLSSSEETALDICFLLY